MRLLFLLVFLPLCLASCPAGHYKDDAFQKCMKCTPCHIVQIPCSDFKDAVCKPITSSESHHLKKKLIHFFDDSEDSIDEDDLDEDYHSKNVIGGFLDDFNYNHKENHHKMESKHMKLKPDEKHHHKKKHFEFDDDNYGGNKDDLSFDFEVDEGYSPKKSKHKKHFEFKKKQHTKKLDDYLSSEEIEDEKLDYILSKESSKKKKEMSHHKKINADEEALEELLKQSERKLKLRKDTLMKTLKEEEKGYEKHVKPNKKVHLNSPVFDSDGEIVYDDIDDKTSKSNTISPESSLKVLADLNENDDLEELKKLDELDFSDDEDIKLKPSNRKIRGEGTVGQTKTPEETIREEMGKPIIFEKPRINVIPFVVEKDLKLKTKKPHTKYFNPSPNLLMDVKDELYNPPTTTKKAHVNYYNPPPNLLMNMKDELYNPDSTMNVLGDNDRIHDDVVSQPFTAAETLVWDWQAVAVASAVASCLVFFLVIAIYFLLNTRQWSKANNTYNKKEFEEMSSRMALMQPTMETGFHEAHAIALHMDNISSKEEEKKCDEKV